MPIAQLDRASVSGTDDSGSTPDRHTSINTTQISDDKNLYFELHLRNF